jgi:hypothetical protein
VRLAQYDKKQISAASKFLSYWSILLRIFVMLVQVVVGGRVQ